MAKNDRPESSGRYASSPRDPPVPNVGARRRFRVIDNPIDLFEAQEYSKYLVGRAIILVKPEFADSTWRACWMIVAEGKATSVVAKQLALTENAVRVAKHRVLARLRVELRGLIDHL